MQSRRREFLLGLVAGSTALGPGWLGHRGIAATETNALDAARHQAAHRRRRVIYNNDGDDIWAKGADTVDKFLAMRHTPLLGTHVDSIFYSTTQSFNFFTHQSKVAEVFRSRDGSFANNNLAKFLEQDTDGLRMSSQFARKHGLETVWTLRMNDIHDAFTPQFRPKWKQKDPRRIMSTLAEGQKHNDRRSLWSLVDFEHPDVEPRLLEIIREVLQNYPVDGIELISANITDEVAVLSKDGEEATLELKESTQKSAPKPQKRKKLPRGVKQAKKPATPTGGQTAAQVADTDATDRKQRIMRARK